MPTAEQLAQIKYFTDLGLSYGEISNTFVNFHAIFMAAALGWGITSRNWKTGLSPTPCLVFAVGYLTISSGILYCIGILYQRMNDAIGVAADLWKQTPNPPQMGHVLEKIGIEHWPNRDIAGYVFGNFFSEGRFYVFILDIVVALAVALLLSTLGRKAAA